MLRLKDNCTVTQCDNSNHCQSVLLFAHHRGDARPPHFHYYGPLAKIRYLCFLFRVCVGRLMAYQNVAMFFISFVAVGALLACAAKPRVEIHMQPIEGSDGTRINVGTDVLIVEKRGVTVTVEPLDEVELFELTDDQRINPYISVDRWGNVESLYTIFEITVRNTENKRVIIGETAILIDEHGGQYASLPYDYFKSLHDDLRMQRIWDHSNSNNFRYYNSAYFADYRVYHDHPVARARKESRIFIRESVFDGSKLFPGAKQMGLLIFERLDAAATNVRVVVPEVHITNEQGNQYNLNFEFKFRQVVAVGE